MTSRRESVALAPETALEFANTVRAVSGSVCDTLSGPAELISWLRDRDLLSDPIAADLADEAVFRRFLALRDALREIAAAVAEGDPWPPAAVELLNDCSSAAPRWPELTRDRGTPPQGGQEIAERTAAEVIPALLAAIARAGIELVGGSAAAGLRRCGAPGCVLFFRATKLGREWCSNGCGNRVRAARHYHRHRDATRRG
jgi:predicted RNA-binding Zn ribbon-like protein